MGLLGKSTDALNDFIDLNPDNYDKNSYKSINKIYERVKFYYENPAIMKEILNVSNNDLSDKNKSNFLKNLTCDDLFGIYLNDISNNINDVFYRSIIILLRHYRDCMNLVGWDIYNKYKDLIDEKTDCEFTSIKNGELLPDIYNDFLKRYIPKRLPCFDKHIASVVICEFNDWLYRRKFTHIKYDRRIEED